VNSASSKKRDSRSRIVRRLLRFPGPPIIETMILLVPIIAVLVALLLPFVQWLCGWFR
jgi:hypothetical protein